MVPKMHNTMCLNHVELSWYLRVPPPSEVGGRRRWAEKRVCKGGREDGESYNERGEDGREVKGNVPCLLASPP